MSQIKKDKREKKTKTDQQSSHKNGHKNTCDLSEKVRHGAMVGVFMEKSF